MSNPTMKQEIVNETNNLMLHQEGKINEFLQACSDPSTRPFCIESPAYARQQNERIVYNVR